MIDVVEIWAGVNSDDVAAEAEKRAASILWGRHDTGVGGSAGCVNRVDQECLEGRFVDCVGCFESLTDCHSPATAPHSISMRLIT